MPIRIPDRLPARKTLEAEGVAVMDSSRAARQDIRPLQIGLLNLMPNKERTETQFTRLIASTPLQVDLTLVRITEHQSKHTSEDYLKSFYSTWEEVRNRKFDGFIVTGAPVANIPFDEVKYWSEMIDIMNWTQTNVHHTMFICWGAQAALHHFHGVRRYRLPHKAFGVYRHQVLDKRSPFLRGFSDDLAIPVSRYNDIDRATLDGDLEILIDNEEIGICMLGDRRLRAIYMLNHLEYDNRSLADEFQRDRDAGLDPMLPVNLFPQRRSRGRAGEPLAQPWPFAVPELDQRDLPDDAVRAGAGGGRSGTLTGGSCRPLANGSRRLTFAQHSRIALAQVADHHHRRDRHRAGQPHRCRDRRLHTHAAAWGNRAKPFGKNGFHHGAGA
jgi:homoserine O-succinyltransferase